jgi:tetratricopeptide (TPR) repeat protein
VRVYHAPRHAIFAATIFAVTGLAGAATPAQAQDNSKDNTRDSTNAAICAPSDETAVSPEQRIAACTALTEKLKDQPQALAAALTDRGATYWYINRWDLAVKDLDRAIALDPNNARAFRERSNGYRTIGRLDRALADANKAVQLDPNDPKAFDNRGMFSSTINNTTAPSPTSTKRCG